MCSGTSGFRANSRSLRVGLLCGSLLIGAAGAFAADTPYKVPPADILAILDAPAAVVTEVSPERHWVIATEQDKKVKAIAELAEPVLDLAGMQIHPDVDTRIEDIGITRLTLKNVDGKTERIIELVA
jgi:hypothetical protein